MRTLYRLNRRQVLGHSKTGGVVYWWQAGGASGCVAAYQPKGAASQADSYINLANPGTYDAAPGVAPTWNTATGWTGNGTTQYLTMGYTHPASSNFTAIVRYASVTNDAYLCGAHDSATNCFRMRPNRAGPTRLFSNPDSLIIAGAVTSGVMAVAGTVCYQDGVAVGNVSGTWSGTPTVAIYLLAQNTAGVGPAGTYMAGNWLAGAFYDTILSGPEVAAVTADILTL